MSNRLTRQQAKIRRAAGEDLQFINLSSRRVGKSPSTSNPTATATRIIKHRRVNPTPKTPRIPLRPRRNRLARLAVRLSSESSDERNSPPIPNPIQQPPRIIHDNNIEMAEANYRQRVTPNFRIFFEDIQALQGDAHMQMRNIERRDQEHDIVTEMNILLQEEALKYKNGQNPSLNHTRLEFNVAITALTLTRYHVEALTADQWCLRKTQSLLEGAFDIIFNIWHLMDTMTPVVKVGMENEIYHMDFLYNKMLSRMNINLKSALTTLEMINPRLVQATQFAQTQTQNIPYGHYVPSVDPHGFQNIPGQYGCGNVNGFNFTPQASYGYSHGPTQTPQHPQQNFPQQTRHDFTRPPPNMPNANSSPQSSAQTQQQNTQRRFDDTQLKIVNTIKSWPNKFDGSQGNFAQHVQEWLKRSTEAIDELTILTNVEYLLEGEALKWHRTFGRSIDNWYDYAKAMSAHVNKGKTDEQMRADFEDSRHDQRSNEDFVTYLTRLQKSANKLTKSLSESELLERIKRGLLAEYFVCKLTANSLNNLMASCTDLESKKHKKGSNSDTDPYAFLKDRAGPSHQQQGWVQQQQNMSQWRGSEKQRDNTRHNSGRQRWWNNNNKNNSSPTTANNVTNVRGMEEENPNDEQVVADDIPPALSRGNAREINDEDREYLEFRETQILKFAQEQNFDKNALERYRARQRCSNCHKSGHTVDQCYHARRGVWFEHCKNCETPNAITRFCPKCKDEKNPPWKISNGTTNFPH